MKRMAFAIVLLFAAGAGADALQEWKTPAGKIYFGDRPPEGSVAVKEVTKPVGKVEVRKLPPLPSAEPLDTGWKHDTGCQDLKVSGVKEKPFEGIDRRIVQGTVTHEGKHLVRDARICGGHTCESLRSGDPIMNGERVDFELDIVDVSNSQRVPLRLECSVHEPA